MSGFPIKTLILLIALMFGVSSAQLSPSFYDTTCPNVSSIIRGVAEQARNRDVRAGAKIIRLHFHDCFVDGCDGSVLLHDADGIDSEKNGFANNQISGDDIVDELKTAVENVCPRVVSCADILALASQILVSLDGGPTWQVQLGRRDSRTANRDGTDAIPLANETLDVVRDKFAAQGLDSTDLVVLSGAHTFGRARCVTFRGRLNSNGTDIDPEFLSSLQENCPSDGDNNLNNLDGTTPDDFDNNYFVNLQNRRGLLQTDQDLFSASGSDTVAIVNRFASSQTDFFDTFGESMIKMGNINPLTGSNGEIRTNCRRVN